MKHVADKLELGEAVTFAPKGNSMLPLIRSGQTVTVSPTSAEDQVKIDDIVLCRVKGKYYLHKIYAIDHATGRYLIGNNRGYKNGWTSTIYGVVTTIHP